MVLEHPGLIRIMDALKTSLECISQRLPQPEASGLYIAPNGPPNENVIVL